MFTLSNIYAILIFLVHRKREYKIELQKHISRSNQNPRIGTFLRRKINEIDKMIEQSMRLTIFLCE